MEKAIYFEYSNEYNEMFEKLVLGLENIDITDNERYSIKPFQDWHFLRGNKKTMLKISLSPTIFEHLITDEKTKEEIDKTIEECIKEIF